MSTIGAFAIIFGDGAKVLLCHRTDRDMWNLPEGRAEPNEPPWHAVVREFEEEVGLQVRVERLLGVYAVLEKQDLVFNFLCVPTAGTLRHTDEADQVCWFERSSIPANTLPRHAERIQDAYSHPEIVCLKVQAK